MALTQQSHVPIALDPLKGDLAHHEVIVSFGVADGALYRKLRKWLAQADTHYLIFIEDEEECFFKAKEAAFVRDPKVRLYFYGQDTETFCKEIIWEFLFLRFTFAAASPYAVSKSEKMQGLFAELEHYRQGIHLLASDYQDLGERVLKNVIANQKHLNRALFGQALAGSCRGIPAVICGAGPSLNGVLPKLAEVQDSGLIFAGGSAAAALKVAHITPHFCAHLDPDPPRVRFLSHQAFEVPHVYQSRFSSSLLEQVHGPLIWMAEGGSYPIERWIDEQYGISSSTFPAGWSVVNFCAAIAVHLGCDPILVVGADFCAAGSSAYAAGMAGDEHAGTWVTVRDAQGNEVLSKRDWVMSAEWLSEYAHAHPEHRWIHAQEGGLEMGLTRLSFNKAAEAYLQEKRDLQGWCHALVQEAPSLGVTPEKIAAVTERLKLSLEQCALLADQMLALWDKSFPHSPMETGTYALCVHDLEVEPGYLHFIEPLWQVWKKPILRNASHPIEQYVHHLLFIKRVVEANLGAFVCT